jgi:hypothetical protein
MDTGDPMTDEGRDETRAPSSPDAVVSMTSAGAHATMLTTLGGHRPFVRPCMSAKKAIAAV